MKDKILITGCNGLLGQKLVSILSKKYNVLATSKGECRINNQSNFKYLSLDVTNQKKVTETILNFSPNFVVNSAAMTNVDLCETQKKMCDDVNVNSVFYISNACEKINAHLIHISTDFVFDGKDGPYNENDIPNPLNYYGKSKLKSENILHKSNCKWTILRTIIIYGFVENMSKSNIVLWARESLKKNETINIIDDQYRSPTLAEDLAMACLLSIEKNARGIFHVSGKEIMSIFEIVERIAKFHNFDATLINKISSSTLNQKAIRPKKTGFILTKSMKVLNYQPTAFEDGLSLIECQIKK